MEGYVWFKSYFSTASLGVAIDLSFLYKIIQPELTSKNALALHSLLVNEWPNIGSFEPRRNGIALPNPLVVILGSEVVGGASFTSDRNPTSNSIAIWLNALLVVSKHRNKGVATRLLQELEKISVPLYALTDISELYVKNNWSVVTEVKDGVIVKK